MRNLAKKGKLEEEGKEQLGDTLIIKQMDVSRDESVNQTVKELLDIEGRIDVLCRCMVFFGDPDTLVDTECGEFRAGIWPMRRVFAVPAFVPLLVACVDLNRID